MQYFLRVWVSNSDLKYQFLLMTLDRLQLIHGHRLGIASHYHNMEAAHDHSEKDRVVHSPRLGHFVITFAHVAESS